MKRWMVQVAVIAILVSFIPLVLIARARVLPSSETRVHLMLDMDAQPKFKPQSSNPMFADGRADRRVPEGTVAQGSPDLSQPLTTGRSGDAWLRTNPVVITPELLARGRERYDIYCAPCHGLSGYGDGLVARRAERLQEGTWTPPSSLHSDLVKGREDGQIFNTITHGIRSMPAYAAQIGISDRWAIVAYVRALERSQATTIDDVPDTARGEIR